MSAASCDSDVVPLHRLFLSFAWVGSVLFGGGYAMLPLLEREVVDRRRWCTHAEMGELYALAQVVPGVIAVNTAMLVGHRHRGTAGAVAATLGMIAVPVAVILAIASSYALVMRWALLERLFAGLRPAVAGLLLTTALRMVGRGCGVGWEKAAAAAACALALGGVSGPLGPIVTAAAAGALWHAWAVARTRKGAR